MHHYMLSDLSFTESCTVSNLFNSFCMNLYSRQAWRFNLKKHLPIYMLLEKRCIKFIYK